MKKITSVLLSSAMMLSLAACGGTAASDNNTEGKKVYHIAIVKQLDHASLDEIADAVGERLDAIAEESGVEIVYDIYSGQGSQDTINQIGSQVIGDHVDAIIPIATMAATTLTVAAEDTKTPIIFAAISDPEGAGLTGIDYVTGTSDALNTNQIFDMIFAQTPEIKKVGLLYSKSETYVDLGSPTTNDEVITAATSLIADQVDVVFTPTDNIIMASELAIAPMFIEAGILHYTGADSFVRNGAFATCGVNYKELGYKTADLAFESITDGMSDLDDFYLMDGGLITVNTETAEKLNADYQVFADFGKIIEVITTED